MQRSQQASNTFLFFQHGYSPTLSCWQSSSAERHSVTPSRLFFIVPDSALEKSCSALTTWSPLSLSRAVFLTTPPRSVASAAKWRSTCATRSSRYRSSETNLYQCMQKPHLHVYWSCTDRKSVSTFATVINS